MLNKLTKITLHYTLRRLYIITELWYSYLTQYYIQNITTVLVCTQKMQTRCREWVTLYLILKKNYIGLLGWFAGLGYITHILKIIFTHDFVRSFFFFRSSKKHTIHEITYNNILQTPVFPIFIRNDEELFLHLYGYQVYTRDHTYSIRNVVIDFFLRIPPGSQQ